MNRISSIEFLRFVFMVLICLGHYGNINIPHFYLGVEFFFIVAGVFLYKAFVNHPDLTAGKFSANRLKKLFPEYIIVLFIMLIMDLVYYNVKCIDISWFDYTHHFVVNSLMLEDIGAFPGQLPTGPIWFISVLVIAGYFIFALLRRYGDSYLKIWMPLSIVFIFTYIFTQFSNINRVTESTQFFHWPLLRGYADMCLGVIIGLIIFSKNRSPLLHPRLFDLFAIISFPLLVHTILSTQSYDQYALIYMSFIIIACLNNECFINKIFKWGNYLGSITYEMLLLHIPVATIWNYISSSMDLPLWLNIIIYLLLVVVVSMIFKSAYSRLMRYNLLKNESKESD